MYLNSTVAMLKILKGTGNNINRMDSNQEITSKLKFIGKLKKGEKVNTRHMYTQPDGLSTSIIRTFIYQDNRGNVLNFCQETISRAFELLVTYERSTYIEDTKFCCDMDTLLQIINARLDGYVSKETDNES